MSCGALIVISHLYVSRGVVLPVLLVLPMLVVLLTVHLIHRQIVLTLQAMKQQRTNRVNYPLENLRQREDQEEQKLMDEVVQVILEALNTF